MDYKHKYHLTPCTSAIDEGSIAYRMQRKPSAERNRGKGEGGVLAVAGMLRLGRIVAGVKGGVKG